MMNTFQKSIFALLILFLASPSKAEMFRFESQTQLVSHKATIGGDLSFPGGQGPFPVVILLHPCGGLDQWARTSLTSHAQALKKAGFATYMLDSFSARGLTAEKVCRSGGEATEFRLDDLLNARAALEKHPKIDKEKFFVLGQSHGAGVALAAAFNQQTKPFRALAAFYPPCRGVLFTLPLKSPLIVFSGGKDDWTPVSSCEDAKGRERPSNSEEFILIVYPNAFHAFDQQRQEPYKFLGHVLAYDTQATQDSRKKMVDFFMSRRDDRSVSRSQTPPKN